MRAKRFAVIFTAALCGTAVYAGAASACTITYTGPSGGQWGQASNWSPARVPTTTDDVCISGATDAVFAPYESGGQQVYSDTANSITVGPQATVEIEGESSSYGGDYYQESDLTANNGVTVESGGTLLFDSTAINVAGGGVPAGATSGGQARLYVGNDPTPGQPTPTLINNGTIEAETDPGTSFGEFIQGSVQNAGSLTNASGELTLQDSNSLASSNSGTLTIAAGAATMLTGGPGFTNSGQITATGSLTLASLSPQTWTEESGGSVSGSAVALYNGDALDYVAGTGSFSFSSGNEENSISGTIPAGQTVSLSAGASGNAIIGLDGTVTNNGTFSMDAPTGATGNPEVDSGPAGGMLVNNGTLDLLDPVASQSNLFRADLTNAASGVIDVQSGTTNFDNGNTLINQGTLLIAPAAAFVQRAGTVTNTGTYSPQIASATDFGTYDLYGGTFNAGGALSPVLLAGYVPTAGQEFDVLNIGNTDTFTGKFSGGGNGFTPDYTHASPEPGDVGAVYAASAARGVVHAGKVIAKNGKLSLKISCPVHDTCLGYTATATVTEHLRGKKLIGLAAAARKTTTKLLTIAKAKGSVAGGKTATVKLSLNKAGAELLKRYGKLKTVVTVTVAGKAVSRSTVILAEPKPVRKKK